MDTISKIVLRITISFILWLFILWVLKFGLMKAAQVILLTAVR